MADIKKIKIGTTTYDIAPAHTTVLTNSLIKDILSSDILASNTTVANFVATGNKDKLTTAGSVKAYVENKITQGVEYLGTVASQANVLAKTAAGAGDWVRANAAFTFNSKHVHAGDLLICNGTMPLSVSSWDIVHTEADTDTNTEYRIVVDANNKAFKLQSKSIGGSFADQDTVKIAAGTGISLSADANNKTITVTNTVSNTHNSHTINSGKKADGTTDIKGPLSSGDLELGVSGALAGAYGDSSDKAPGYSGTFKVPFIRVNNKGIVTDISEHTVTIPASDNTNTSHSHSAGVGLVGSGSAGTSGGTYTYKAKLRSETALTLDSAAAKTTSGRVYPVAIDKSSYLSVNVPWTDTKNTAGSTNSAEKLYLVGAKTQAANPQTYSNNKVYVQDNKLYSNNEAVVTSSDLNNYLPLSGGTSHPLTAPVYIAHNDISFIGTAGAFGFRAIDPSGQLPHHLGQINLSKNFGGDGNQYGIQMSAVDITNSRFNQFRVYQLGIAYQHYDIASKTATDIFTVDTAGQLDAAKIRVAKKATMQYNSTEDCIEFIFA